MCNLIIKKKNGNYAYKIYSDGTKIRQSKQKYVVDSPENIDLKITNKCDLGCRFCHENSVDNGIECSLNFITDYFQNVDGLEVAIGGGNPSKRLL